MRTARVAGRVVALGLAAVLEPAAAFAPVGHYAPFTDSAAAIEDRRTGLVWDRVSSTTVLDGPGAASYCAGARRVPTYKELLTLVDEEPARPFVVGAGPQDRFIDVNAFPEMLEPKGAAAFLSVDPGLQDPGNRFAVSFRTGQGTEQNFGYVRCVRR